MSNAVAQQFASGIRQSMAALGADAQYVSVQGGESCSLRVLIVEPGYQMDVSQGVITTTDSAELYFVAVDLSFDGTNVYVPQIGDSVVVSVDGTDYTYTVLAPDQQKYCWTWADKFHCRRKLSTKLSGE